jgi:SAM-dependent methyltransferase
VTLDSSFGEALGLLRRPEYPRSSKYDPEWLLELDMGPNPLWLLDDVCDALQLSPGMLVLDLGSGKGASSVFLAREFGVHVWAVDLWVDPNTAAQVFRGAGVANQVHALRAEAHTLPFARETFDAIVSIDAFEYFGTSDTYIKYISSFLKPGGQIGMATPGLTRELRDLGTVPAHIQEAVGADALAWHTAEWWRFQWEMSGCVKVTDAHLKNDFWQDWLIWSRASAMYRGKLPDEDRSARMLEQDRGALVSFAVVAAIREEHPPESNG